MINKVKPTQLHFDSCELDHFKKSNTDTVITNNSVVIP